jgi:enamine deaminase RidA (YjgF/YER057c/UK114 family)
MNDSFPINEFRIASLPLEDLPRDQQTWDDIPGLSVDFGESEGGNFLITLTLPGVRTDQAAGGSAHFQVVLRTTSGDQTLFDGISSTTSAQQFTSLSLTGYAAVSSVKGGSQIVAQWQVLDGGTAYISGISSLSAVGSLGSSTAGITKAPFDDPNHWEDPGLFSRGLRLSAFSEILFVTGYGPADVGGDPGKQTTKVASPCDPPGQVTWITKHLDDYFAKIPYADGTGFFSKQDIVYFDLVVASSISDADQQAVLDKLATWFGPVDPKPATGILKKVTGLAVSGMMVEIEFILAH